MNPIEKKEFSKLKKINEFKDAIRKLTLNEVMTQEEKSYLLGCAIILIKKYECNVDNKTYLEFAYYIILKYSILYKDYEPLYDFSINFGYFPIANIILNNKLLSFENIENLSARYNIDKYKKNNIVKTKEQQNIANELLNDKFNSISFIAPTSYGKSEMIKELINKNNDSKIAIIVPTKSLINQTYRDMKEFHSKYKLLIHDEMYNGEEKVLAILTQERALRMYENNGFYFDTIYMDESHKIYENDYRSIMLSRVIRMNFKRNTNQKVFYLSPLISDSQNLLTQSGKINEHRIEYNIKEAEIYELNKDRKLYKYNRFVNEFYECNNQKGYLEYIEKESLKKNFIFVKRPKLIEKFAIEFSKQINDVKCGSELTEFSTMLAKYVSTDFYMIDLIKKGIVYLHGKIPDSIKAYIEYKYKKIENIKYVIANQVILEGINLPINKLFILSTHAINKNDLINLIGRVNRLNEIFYDGSEKLSMLMPPIHFIDTEEYNSKRDKMDNKIKELRSYVFEDELYNPTLYKYNIDNNKMKIEEKIRKKQKDKKIVEQELLVLSDDEYNLRKLFVEMGISQYYLNIEQLSKNCTEKLKLEKKDIPENIIEKIYIFFIKDETELINENLKRLREIKSREYYKNFLEYSKKNLSERIKRQYEYFKDIQYEKEKNEFYIGDSYGEVSKITDAYNSFNRNVYINLSQKTDKELINLAIVKIKMEDDFLNYTLASFINILYKTRVITEEEYNIIIYGTNNCQELELIKKGLSKNMVDQLIKDGQLKNIHLDEQNNLMGNNEFEKYKMTLDDYNRFLIELVI